jgi:GNAT superfamily N-acetyltransferase
MALDIVECVNSDDWRSAWRIIGQLRSGLSEAEYLSRLEAARPQGYRLFLLEQDGRQVGAIGWRIVNDLASGRSLYVDDLVVDESIRSQGHGHALIEFAREKAKAEGCNAIRLSSNLQRIRAHAFYEREGFDRRGYSFFADLG